MNILQAVATFITKTLPHALADFFAAAKTDGDRIAIAITQAIKTALESGVVMDIAQVIEAVFPGVKNLPVEIVTELQTLVPKILAAELEVQGLPANATPDQINAFTTDVLAAFNVKADKSKAYSTLAASLYQLFRAYTGATPMTWAELMDAVEKAFQAFQNNAADEQMADA